MDHSSQQEREEFKAEALDLLDLAEKSLLALDQGADFQTSFDAIFRGFHNLKGAAGMMELTELQSHTHRLEDILMTFKNATGISKAHVGLFLRGIDAARALLDGQAISFTYDVDGEPEDKTPQTSQQSAESLSVEATAGASEGPSLESAPELAPAPVPVQNTATALAIPAEMLNEFLADCEETIDRVSQDLQRLEQGQITKERIDSLYRDVHSLKGAAYLFALTQMGDHAHAMESALEPVREGLARPTPELISALFKRLEAIEFLLAEVKASATPPAQSSVAPVVATSSPTPVAQPPSEGAAPPADSGTRESSEGAGTIRVPVALLDNLMTLMGEMVLVRNQVLQYSNNSEDLSFLSMSKRLSVVTSEMQGEMMKTRMQPIGNVINKFTRVVRDLSHELGKSIQLTISGAETELDKSLLEAIKDPLTHIVRNSCDHGIEVPDARRQAGKPATGTVAIKAYHEGGQVVIEVADDGKGLHKEALCKKAVEKGLLTQAQADGLSEKEAFQLIFAPGFSTAAKVTNVSGRGVGMDVVRTNIEKVSGSVDLNSSPGRGTTMKLKIPLTLAIVPALIVKGGSVSFAIPQVKLEELVRVDQSSSDAKIEMLHGSPIYRLRGQILPLVDLKKILQLGVTGENDQTIYNIAVLNTGQTQFGLIIDEIQDTADIVVKPLNRLLKSLHVYSGATILGDGSVTLILDVSGIAKLAQIDQDPKDKDAAKANALNDVTEIQDYLLVRLHSPTKHAVVLNYVNRLEEFTRDQVEYSGQQRVVRYSHAILPLISANELLGYPVRESQKETISAFVVQRSGQLFGIEVDDIIDILSTEVEASLALNKRPGFFGNLNTEEELIVVIDPFELISLAFPQMAAPSHHASVSSLIQGLSPDGSGKRILFAEDTVFFRKAIAGILRDNGFEVVTVNDGQQALDELGKGDQPFDLVISDIEMPKINGFQLATQIRQQPQWQAIPLLAISSRFDQRYQEQGTKAGFNLYLEKLKPETLLSAVNQLLENRRAA